VHTVHIAVKELSPHVRNALASVGYGAKDILVEAANEIHPSAYAGEGQRAFCVILNLTTGERKTLSGSWGGSNMFTSTLVDDTRGEDRAPMPEDGVVIKGSIGYPRTFATIYAHPNTVGRFLPSGEDDEPLTDGQAQALYCHKALKGGHYRREEMERRGCTTADVDALVERGLLKRNRAGATQITTAGKNACTVNR
jgi:hypothetical protein